MNGDRVPQRGLPPWGTHLVAGLGSHWDGAWGSFLYVKSHPAYLDLMVRFIIEIEQVPGEAEGVNVVMRSEKQQPAPIEEALAERISPTLRALPSTLRDPPAAE